MSNWPHRKIGNVGKVVTGNTPSSDNPQHFGDKAPFITPSDFGDYIKHAHTSERSLSEEGVEALESKVLPAGSVMVTCIGSDMGKVAMSNSRCVTNQQINSVVCDETQVDADWLYYVLCDKHQLLRRLAGDGTAMPIVNKEDFQNIEVPVPPLPVQRRIADILGALDDKIELNRRMNENLEEMAQTLYRHWFVDFGPFQDREFKDTEELGPIPGEWEVRELDSFFPVKTGKKNASASVEDGDYPFFTCAQDVSRIDDWEYDEHSILLAGNGNFNVKWYRGKFDAYQRTYVLTPQNPDLLGVLYFAMEHYLEDLTLGRQGTVIEYLTKSMISDYPLAWPPERDLREIVPKFRSIMDLIEHNESEAETLAETRDYLLPKLISGEIEVEAAEEIAEETVAAQS